jgi:hypothetical protein
MSFPPGKCARKGELAPSSGSKKRRSGSVFGALLQREESTLLLRNESSVPPVETVCVPRVALTTQDEGGFTLYLPGLKTRQVIGCASPSW